MDKPKFKRVAFNVMWVLLVGGIFYGDYQSAKAHALEMTGLHQEVDKEAKTIHSLQVTVERQEKELKTLQQEVDAANQKAAFAEQKASEVSASRP